MLILRRKTGESLMLGNDIKVTVVESNNDGVRLAIDAPKEIPILREELMEAMKANQEAAAAADKKSVEKLRGMFAGRK